MNWPRLSVPSPSLLPLAERKPARSLFSRALAERQARTGLALTLCVALFVLAAPWFAGHEPTALVGPIYGDAAAGAPLGFDYLGHDVWSRVATGGASVVLMSLAVASLAWVVGTVIGLFAGYSRRAGDTLVVWCADAFHAFPNLILVLLVVSMLGRERWLIVLTAASAMVPGVVRLARGLTLGVARREFVEAAEMMGYSRWRIRLFEILPNILTPLLVHLGTMLSWSVGILSGLAFLGYGVAPPAPDWGLMINENRAGLQVQPWGVLAPTVLIAMLALGANLLAESVGRVAARIEER